MNMLIGRLVGMLALTTLSSCASKTNKPQNRLAVEEGVEKPQADTMKVPGKVITIDFIRGMFERIEGQGHWDMSKPMLWGYFFTDNEQKQLNRAKARLVSDGYRFVDVFMAEKEEADAPDLWFLHVEKVELHTPESLDKRNDDFYRLAQELGVDTYDGMDVGLASATPPSGTE